LKSIKLCVLHHKILRVKDEFHVQIPDDGSVIDAIAAADRQLRDILKGKPFPIEILNNLLQLLWNPKSGQFYIDLGIDARDSENNWLPITDNPFYNIPDNSSIFLTPDAGC